MRIENVRRYKKIPAMPVVKHRGYLFYRDVCLLLWV